MNTLLRVHVCTFRFTHTFVATAPPTPLVSHTCDKRGPFKLWVVCIIILYKPLLHYNNHLKQL